MNKKIVIIGASGHGKVIADIAKNVGYEEIIFLDDNCDLKKCGDYPIVGDVSKHIQYDCDMIIAIGNADTRKRIQSKIKENGKTLATLIHPAAVISENVTIGDGTVVMAGAVVNAGSTIGQGCIINTCASVDHDCIIEDYVHVSVGAHLAGTVYVGGNTWIGIGAVISNNIKIAANCTIGAGTVVIRDIVKQGVYVGVPAKMLVENKNEDSDHSE